jgi:hypothetical protein
MSWTPLSRCSPSHSAAPRMICLGAMLELPFSLTSVAVYEVVTSCNPSSSMVLAKSSVSERYRRRMLSNGLHGTFEEAAVITEHCE